MNEQEIREIFEEEHKLVLLILEPYSQYKYWAHPFKALEFMNTKACYGKASTNGVIKLSRVFLNTREYSQLRDTIRHELAHLIVGNKHGHDSLWRYVACLVGASPKRCHEPEGTLTTNMKRKWLLIGTLRDGTEVELQASHNKMSKYLRYNPVTSQAMRCSKGNIMKFHYVRNK